MPPKPDEIQKLMPLVQYSDGWYLTHYTGDETTYPMWATIEGSFKAVQSNGEFLDRKFDAVPDGWDGGTVAAATTFEECQEIKKEVEQIGLAIGALDIKQLTEKLDKIIYMLDHRAQ